MYYGKNVSLGYATDVKDLYKGDENKGKLFTGDLGKKDKNGFIYITGRKKEFQNYLDLELILMILKLNRKRISSSLKYK